MSWEMCEQFGINMKGLIHKGRREAADNAFTGKYADIFAVEFAKGYMNALEIASKELAARMKADGEPYKEITRCTSIDEGTIARLDGSIVLDEELECATEFNTGLQFFDFGVDQDEIFIRAIKEMRKYDLSGRHLREAAIQWRRNYIIGTFQVVIEVSRNLIKDGWTKEIIRHVLDCSQEAYNYLKELYKRKPNFDKKDEAEHLYSSIMWRWL